MYNWRCFISRKADGAGEGRRLHRGPIIGRNTSRNNATAKQLNKAIETQSHAIDAERHSNRIESTDLTLQIH